MNEFTHPSDEKQEILAFLESAKELEAVQALEEAEFIKEDEDAPETLDQAASSEIQEAPPSIITDESARHSYWQAQGLVEFESSVFEKAVEDNNIAMQRNAYYRLAVYHGRTIAILNSALADVKEALAQAAMRNLETIHRAMMQMHRKSPQNVPFPLVIDQEARTEFSRDLVIHALQETTEPVDLERVVNRVNELHILKVSKAAVERHLKDVVSAGYVDVLNQRPALYKRTQRAYAGMNINTTSLRTLVGLDFYNQMEREGFSGLTDVAARQASFRDLFVRVTGLNQTSAALFIDLVETMLESKSLSANAWNVSDLIGSPIPRPYQYEAYAVFRGYGYHGQLVEAPTGSGKTMIGMMCIQDWLNDLIPGQSILILVPTSNYLQQWTGELCYKSIGLRLSPELVFAGTPNQLERFQKRTGSHPAILLMTYTALSQAGSAIGKGGFDTNSIESFLQGANVQYVVLDEVHKVAENLKSVSSDVIRLMMEWLNDGSLQGLIGFTGTAEAYRSRFENLGLQLVYSIPIDELIAAGYVAPFAELGAPFSYSDRERRIRDLLERYKVHASDFMNLIGPEKLRTWFSTIALEKRVSIGHDLLNMYQGRTDWQTTLPKRLSGWESGGAIQLTEIKLVSIVQIAKEWSDEDLVREAGADSEEFGRLVSDINATRRQLMELIYLPSTIKRLQTPGFTRVFDVAALHKSIEGAVSQTARTEALKDGLAANIIGLYEGLSEWYRRIGEGRVETIKAVIEAEKATRELSGIIIFDQARRINWKQNLSAPGYEGVSGLFAQLLGDKRFTPYAVLSSEQYLPYDAEDPLTLKISAFVEHSMMQGEIASAMFSLVSQGLDLPADVKENLREHWFKIITSYIPRLSNVRAARPGGFSRQVLRPMRSHIRELGLGAAGDRLLNRIDLRNIHFADLVTTFFDYAIIARYFRQAKVAELEQVSGERQKYFVIPMPGGNRKLLMYDLTSRIVDAESLPINMIIVSSWARTGWNVILPNVLIDATATRDVTAWQQLRGRAIRARRTWTNDCYRLILALIGSQMSGLVEHDDLPEDVSDIMSQMHAQPDVLILDQPLKDLLYPVLSEGLRSRIENSGLTNLTGEERLKTAIALMRRYNKVTHIFELVKAYGSTTQVEYNRSKRAWQRRENIAVKHEFEVAVNPLTGEKLTGVGHAPLLYAQDPRTDIPTELEKKLIDAVADSDEVIVSGWLRFSMAE